MPSINGSKSRRDDPAGKHRGIPPNFGRGVVPHVATFVGFISSFSKSYRPSDEALRHSIEQARYMRNDTSIMECLEARQRATALLNWHIEPEDEKDPEQVELVENLTRIVELTPRFTEYRRWLLEAIWFGRVASQNIYGWDIRPRQKKRLYVRRWMPIHGDKLVFRFDDGTGKYSDDQIGIKYTQFVDAEDFSGRFELEPTDYGMAYFLKPWERSLLTVHRHMIEDGAYEDPQSAGRIHGVGIRDRIYWTWYQKQEVLGMLIELIERTGMGFNIWYYPAGNDQAYQDTVEAAKNQSGQNAVLIPRTPGDPALDGYGYDRIEPSGSGIQNLKDVIHEFFGHQIKRYILGQTLSSEADATGLGSGVADLHLESFLQIVKYDATNLEESITTDLIEHLKRFNFPGSSHFRVKFKIDTEAADVQAKLQAVFTAWQMGAAVRTADVFDMIGLSVPGPDDQVLANPQLQQQPAQEGQEPPKSPHQAVLEAHLNEEPNAHGESPQQALLEVLTPSNSPASDVAGKVVPRGVTRRSGNWNITQYNRSGWSRALKLWGVSI